VFITGTTGFIGKQLLGSGLRCCTYLEPLEIRILSREPHPDYETVVCDLQSEQVPKDALFGIDTIFHLAGVAHDQRDGAEIELLYRAVNVDATIRLAELAATSGVQQFVFVSSVKAGGKALHGRYMTESNQGEPEGVYGQTKREAEIRLLEIGLQSKMHVSIVRPSLVYGPGIKGNLRLMLSGIEKGWFPPLPEVGNRRSLIHVDDLVRVLLLVANDERANGEIYIATDGQPYSSREICESMCYVLGKPIPKWSVPKT
jgi:nucleoside-diphosphate-sugar epimerase